MAEERWANMLDRTLSWDKTEAPWRQETASWSKHEVYWWWLYPQGTRRVPEGEARGWDKVESLWGEGLARGWDKVEDHWWWAYPSRAALGRVIPESSE